MENYDDVRFESLCNDFRFRGTLAKSDFNYGEIGSAAMSIADEVIGNKAPLSSDEMKLLISAFAEHENEVADVDGWREITAFYVAELHRMNFLSMK